MSLTTVPSQPNRRTEGLGQVLWSPADLEPGQVNQPDIFALPSIAFERWEDARGLKRRFYQRAGVPELPAR